VEGGGIEFVALACIGVGIHARAQWPAGRGDVALYDADIARGGRDRHGEE